MTKATNRNFLLSLLLCMALVFAFAMTMPTHNVAYAEEVSTFIFTPTSDTECSVRLSNKTVDKAIVPERALINGNEYTVTSIAGNGFASASNLKKVRLPKTVKTIGNSAFANCSALNSITLTAVESIGTSAFNLCTSLQYLIIPETMITVAPTILRNCNTQVYVRTSESKTQELGWAANWNASNANQAVEFSSTFTPEVEYVEVYNNSARSYSSNAEIIGYYVADDQPFREEREDDVYVYIPDVYQGQPVMGIMDTAFLYNNITYLTIGYAEAPLHIDSYAFNGLDGNVVTINRDINIDVIDWQGNEQLAEFLFADSSVSTVILPDSMSGFGPYMFSGCANLTDIHFLTPRERTGKTEEENIKNEFTSTQIVNLPTSTTFSKICTEAFSGTSGLSELNIPKNVTTVEEFAFIGWNLPQTISIAFEQEANLPQWDANLKQGWHPNWKEGCPSNVIQFQGEYAITYHLNGGTHSGNPTTYTSKDNTYLNDASRLGYTFNGWYNNSSFSGDSVSVIEKGSSGDKELYAKWTANEYTIRFNSNKPSLASANILGSTALSEHVFDISKALSQNGFSLAGWTFQSWNTKADGSGMSYANAETIENLLSENNAEMTLFAQWTPIQYSVIYNNNKPSNASGLLSGTTESSSHVYDVYKTLTNNGFNLVGWTFNGWNTQSDGNGIAYANHANVKNLNQTDGDTVILYAQWMPISYSVTYQKNKPVLASANLNGTMANSTFVYEELQNLTLCSYTLTGWTFSEWNTMPDGSGTAYSNGAAVKNLTASSSISLYAQWTPNQYTIIFNSNKPSDATAMIKGSTNNSVHYYDTAKTLSLNGFELQGWRFTGWNTNSNGSGTSYSNGESILNYTSTNNAYITFYARWMPDDYFVKYNKNKPSNASNSVLGTMEDTSHSYETSKALKTNNYTLKGWTFKGWNTKADGSGSSYTDGQNVVRLTLDDTITLYAQWTAYTYTVRYYSNKPSTVGVLSGTMDSSTHTYDTTKKLNTNGFILTGWTFIEWNTTPNGSGTSCSNNASVKNLTSTKGGTIDLYAQWKINEYSITYEDLHYRWSESEPWMELANPNASITSYTIDTPTIKFVQPEPGVGVTFTWTTTEIRKGSTGNMFIGLSYRKHTYTLQAVYGGDLVGYSAPVKTIVVTYDDIIDISCKVEEDGGKYIFDHWERDGNNIGSTNALKLTRLTPYDGGFVRIVAVYYKKSCVAEGTMITLADGSQKAVEMLTGEEELLVWNLKTGQFDTSPIIFIDSDPLKEYEVINLQFSDNTSVKVIYEHAFWDFDLNQYVFLRKDAAQYIGHWFQKQIINANGNLAYTRVKLTNVTITTEMTTSWSPVTYEHLCYFVNGMLSMPGGTEGLINIFDVDSGTMQYDEEAMQDDIEEYGLFTYDEFVEIIYVPEYIFNAFDVQYFKVAIGKGYIDLDMILELIARYIAFFE